MHVAKPHIPDEKPFHELLAAQPLKSGISRAFAVSTRSSMPLSVPNALLNYPSIAFETRSSSLPTLSQQRCRSPCAHQSRGSRIPLQALQHHPAPRPKMSPPQFPKDNKLLVLLGSSFSQTLRLAY